MNISDIQAMNITRPLNHIYIYNNTDIKDHLATSFHDIRDHLAINIPDNRVVNQYR
jgi:hypothetical protein